MSSDRTDLDPADWGELRTLGQRMLDDMFDYLEHIRSRPAWQPIPETAREPFRQPLPQGAQNPDSVYQIFLDSVLPYSLGNVHPGFIGWVHGAGTPVGMLADMLAAGLNPNLGGRDHMPVEVERQILRWARELFGFPAGASGLFVTGTSTANLIALLVARTAALGPQVRRRGLADGRGPMLVAYTSTGSHGSIASAMEMTGLGSDALRRIAVDNQGRLDPAALRAAMDADRAAGLHPFFVAATAGTAATGAVDDLQAIAAIARAEQLWFHVDGAYGALAILADDLAPRLAGIELADSLAFDFHKWGQVPYDAGFVLVRDGELHRSTFFSPADYLQRTSRGTAAGSPWACDFGPDLSRGFRALKAWFTLKTYGTAALGCMISHTCALARYAARRIEAVPELELLAPVSLNIVCFGLRCDNADDANAGLAVALQESGVAVPSTTRIGDRVALRAAIVNHRTTEADIDALLEAARTLGRTYLQSVAEKPS